MATEPLKPTEARTVSPPSVEPALLDVDQISTLLGVSARTVYRLADRGAMPEAIRLGALRRWRRVEIERWLDDGCPQVGEP